VAALPRPRVVLVRAERSIGAMLILDSRHADDAAAYTFVMRFRRAPDSPLSDYRQFPAAPKQPVWPRGRDMSGGRVCVQPGVNVGEEVLYEPWTCLPTSEAIDYLDVLQSELGSADGGAP